MTSFQDILTERFIRDNSLPSNFVYGKAIHSRKAIEFIERSAHKIEAWAGGLDGAVKEGAGSRRRVTFMVDNESLRWSCTGNPKNHQIFCKHCVAVAIAVMSS